MRATLPYLEAINFPRINRNKLETLQVNIGYLCNQSCLHCHVNAGPSRKEVMQVETMEQILAFIDRSGIKKIDITGGAPELNPYFSHFIQALSSRGIQITDRCNLTVLLESGQEDTIELLASHNVEIVASLPCYSEDNVDLQRGKGVFDKSIDVLRMLNNRGYGIAGSGLILNLMYNPVGAFLPPPQQLLEQDYRKSLFEKYGIEFNSLYTLVNMPIQRFGSVLLSKGGFEDYMNLLMENFDEKNLASVMCKNLISIDWQGYVYDCDFNQMLNMPVMSENDAPLHISALTSHEIETLPVIVGGHCYGCTAGGGSSCGGALS